MRIIIIILGYVIGIFVIGVPMARKGYRLWLENYPNGSSGGIWGFLLFPATSMDGKVGNRFHRTFIMPDDICRTDRELEYAIQYISTSAVFWAPRIVMNIFIYGIVSIFLIIEGILAVIGGIVRKTYKI